MSHLDAVDEHFDVVVVGGGASGASLAWTLNHHSQARVLVVDSGGAGPAPKVTELPRLDSPHPAMRWFDAELVTQPLQVPRGAGLGGSMQVNGGYFLWPDPDEIARWSETDAWSTPEVAASFRRTTVNDDDDSIVAVRRADIDGIGQMFVDACVDRGIPYRGEKNSVWTESVGPLVMNTDGSTRSTPGDFLCRKDQLSGNVEVLTHVKAERVLFENHEVVGVELVSEADGSVRHVATGRVVLCAGSIETPEVMIRSGIGPAQLLAELGISPIKIANSLGQRAWEHPVVELPVVWDDLSEDQLTQLITTQHFVAAAHLDIEGQVVELMPVVRPYNNHLHSPVSLPIRCTLMTPASSSRLRFTSQQAMSQQAMPEQPGSFNTTIEYGHLEHEQDRHVLHQALLVALDIVDRLIELHGLSSIVSVDLQARQSIMGSQIDQWLYRHIDTAHHLMGTTPMGPTLDPYAVVDEHGKVHGVHGLWVGDVSIVPQPLSRGTAATAVMIGTHIGVMLCNQELN